MDSNTGFTQFTAFEQSVNLNQNNAHTSSVSNTEVMQYATYNSEMFHLLTINLVDSIYDDDPVDAPIFTIKGE